MNRGVKMSHVTSEADYRRKLESDIKSVMDCSVFISVCSTERGFIAV